MARVAWVFNGYSWPVNPSQASDWKDDPSYVEDLPIKGGTSSLQYVGKKAGRRTISGTIIGTSANEFHNYFKSWRDTRVFATLTDHFGNSRQCRIFSFNAEEKFDLRSWKSTRPVYVYNVEFIAV